MKDRLKKVIEYKTGGKIGQFGRLFGWSPQYTSALLKKEGGIGLNVIKSILEAMPEISARWLILGEGNMIEGKFLCDKVVELLSLEKYIPVMSEDELAAFVSGSASFSALDKERWQIALDLRQAKIERIFEQAYERMRESSPNA